MSSTLDAFLRSWPFDPWLSATLALSAGIYLRGWYLLNRRDPQHWHRGQPAAFVGGLSAIFLALASPIEPFASLLLQLHMVQHLLLMMVAPPLIWLGSPLFPLVRGLPEQIRTYWAAPLLRSRSLRQFFAWLTHPLVAWPLYVAAAWLWHTPRAYDLALRSNAWHVVEHACFVGAALLFWYPVVRPYPSRPRWSQWILFPYLILADVQNTVLAAWLTFSGGVLYPHYTQVPRIAGIPALDDQAAAGVIMWVPGSIAFLLPLFWIGTSLLFGRKSHRKTPAPRQPKHVAGSLQLPILNAEFPARMQHIRTPPTFDLLRVPIIGRFLCWRFGRPVAQSLVAILAVAVIFDGFRGPQTSAMNLAGVIPWIHWRGLVILGLLVAGNAFCFACPFTLPRAFARRWLPGHWRWPRWLRNKWLAVGLLAFFLWSYEALALWDNPWWTAWIAVGYFLGAFVVDGLFGGSTFCKYVCPIGQFNFVQSLVSPLEVKVREPAVCGSCRTKECIRGSSEIPGCEMHLFQPRKTGNLDCTFCLDCVHACPHQNVGILAVVPGRTLWSDRFRSGIGRFSRRPDLAALVVLLVFGAFTNAAGMVGPVVEWQEWIRTRMGNPSPMLVTTMFYAIALVALPVASVGIATIASRFFGNLNVRWLEVATRYSYALVPLGFGMWLAHYSFHFLTSYDTIVPTTQRFMADIGLSGLGSPLWQCSCCRPIGDWLLHLEIVMLDFGLLLSLYASFRIAETQTVRASEAIKAFAPWGTLIVLLFLVGIWILFQPMQMRGTLAMTG